MSRARLWSVVAAIVISSCSSGGGAVNSGPGSSVAVVTVTAANSVAQPVDQSITGFGTGQGVNADFVALEADIGADPVKVEAGALAHLGDADPSVHYAAVYALSRTAKSAGSMTALATLLTSARVEDRLLAATALAYRGDKSSLPALIDELGSTDAFVYWEPAQTTSDFARAQLLRFTNQDLGLRAATDPAAAANVKQAWQQWWKDHGATLRWDPAIEEFG